MINRKNFIQTVCVAFTCIVLGKVILEAILQHQDAYYIPNILFMFLISFCATFILAIHRFFVNIPLLFVIIGQYVLVVLFALLIVFIGTIWEPVSEGGYFDIFRSVTIPYVIGAVIYYISYFYQIRHANQILHEIQTNQREA